MSTATGNEVAARYLRKLSVGVSAAADAFEAATDEALSEQRAEEAVDRAVILIERESGRAPDSEELAELKRVLLQDGKEAIRRLQEKGSQADLTAGMAEALEAIVEVDGSRPTLELSENDRLDLTDPMLGAWRDVAKAYHEQIARVAVAVGRIDLDGAHKGTGFMVKQGLVLTNRHVLQELAHQASDGTWEFTGEPSITFDADPKNHRARQFRLQRKVLQAGAEHIDPFALDYNKLDYAILECEPHQSLPFPEPLQLESDDDKVAVGRPLYVLGYPAKPKPGLYQSSVLQLLFKYRYGVKRFAPGEIDRELGTATDNTGETVFTHDATTLGGNSGSCVVDLGNDGRLVVGLHFAGRALTANYAHSNARLREELEAFELGWRAWI
jgi:V8-like Glu-specific endopeptidase